ncbi:MAG: hypothetical protein ACXV3D_05520 [Halobacteriota archaeon]
MIKYKAATTWMDRKTTYRRDCSSVISLSNFEIHAAYSFGQIPQYGAMAGRS